MKLILTLREKWSRSLRRLYSYFIAEKYLNICNDKFKQKYPYMFIFFTICGRISVLSGAMHVGWQLCLDFHSMYHAHLKGAATMTRRSRLLAAILAVLTILIMVAAAGCASGQNLFTRMKDGRLEHTEGANDWIWNDNNGTVQITLNDKLFAVIAGGRAQISLPPDGRSVDVTTGSSGEPISVKAAWGVLLSQSDYALMNEAFNVNKLAGGQGHSGSLGWVIFLLLVIIVGVLLFVYAGRLVNSWKLGGIFSGRDTAKSLLLFKALGILVIVVGVIILLAVIF
jgi:hypothetical protein